MNKLAAVLNYKPEAGTEYIRHYPRAVDLPDEYKGIAQILVPDNPDANYRNFMVDQLVTLVHHMLPTYLQQLDPTNTYDRRYARKNTEPTSTGLPGNLSITFLEEENSSTDWLQDTVFVEVDVPNDLVYVDKVQYTLGYHNNATNSIEYKPGFRFMLLGPMSGVFTFNILAYRAPYRDLVDLIEKLRMLDTYWLPKYTHLTTGANVELWLSLYILNYFEQVLEHVHF